MAPMTTADVAAEFGDQIRGLTRQQYDVLVGEGFFEDQKVELLRGLIVEMSPSKAPHLLALQWLNMHLARRLPEHVHVRVQSGWAASDDSEPEPDLAVVEAEWPLHESGAEHPQTAYALVEVAYSSHRRDLVLKAEIYAEAGLESYVVIELQTRDAVLHRTPENGRYTCVERVAAPATITIADVEVPLAELFAFAFMREEPAD